MTASNPKHRERARAAIADNLCTMQFTDGFCRADGKPDCRCNAMAESCIRAIEARGMIVVWPFDKESAA